MPCNWRELSFGVEIEFSFIKRAKAAEIVSDFFKTSYFHSGDKYDTYEIEDFQQRIWKVVRDGSVTPEKKIDGIVVQASDYYKVELVTPILYYKQDMEILQKLVRKLRKSGAKANNDTGVHIHIGAKFFENNPNNLRILCNMVYSKQNLLERAIQVHNNRKRFCELLSDDFIKKLNKVKPKTLKEFADIWYGFDTQKAGYQGYRSNKYHKSRYRILNLHNLLSGRMKCIEFRIFNGTLHSGVIKSYVQFCLLLTAQSLNQSRASCKQKSTINERWSMRIWLLNIGMIGEEFKTARHHLIKFMEGDCAFKNKVLEGCTF
ncbi:amidoligase family protein [Clostridium drakei]|uniref:amidoligase family protein n=1 Tax=Clostridium drakei TaxID=332101 RepID=UPI000509DFAC|nr:amidoligase family protein [Clostridium drakei]